MCFENSLDHARGSACREPTGRTDVRHFLSEPSLDEILADPLVRLLMTSDNVEDATLRHLAMRIARHVPTFREVAP